MWLIIPSCPIDVASANQGHVGLKAFRLSAAFVEAHRAGKFDTQRFVRSPRSRIDLID